MVHPQSNSKLGLLRIDNEVTFVTHTSATDVFDPEDHNKVLDSPTAATSVLVINPGLDGYWNEANNCHLCCPLGNRRDGSG